MNRQILSTQRGMQVGKRVYTVFFVVLLFVAASVGAIIQTSPAASAYSLDLATECSALDGKTPPKRTGTDRAPDSEIALYEKCIGNKDADTPCYLEPVNGVNKIQCVDPVQMARDQLSLDLSTAVNEIPCPTGSTTCKSIAAPAAGNCLAMMVQLGKGTIESPDMTFLSECLAQASGKPINTVKVAIESVYQESLKGVTDTQSQVTAADKATCEATVEDGGLGGTWDATANKCATTKQSRCNVDGVGWLVCPVMVFIGGLNDGLYSFIASTLEVRPELFSSESSTAKAWGVFRNIANVMFIIVFLIIVFSQVTSAGISNYGIKRMLPRLIIAAILVNASFLICQLMVDISNVLGYSMKSLFEAIGGPITTDSNGISENGWQTFVGALLAGTLGIGAALLLLLSITAPVLLAALLALSLIAFILLARQALVVLLIAIAPIAFVLYLLPNTNSWYKKWSKMFFSLLMLFPVISVVFGASALAAKILLTSDEPMMKITALAASVLPLFVVPSLLKGAMNASGTLGGKLSSMAGNQTGRAKKGMSERLGESRAIVAQRASNAANRSRIPGVRRIMTGRRRRETTLNTLKAEGNAIWEQNSADNNGLQELYNREKSANSAGHEAALEKAKSYATTVIKDSDASPAQKAAAQSSLDEMERKETAAHAIALEGATKDSLVDILDNSKSSTQKAAALERLMDTEGPEEYEQYVEKYAKDQSLESRIIRQKMSEGLGKTGMFRGAQLGAMRDGTFKFDPTKDGASMGEVVQRNIAANVVSPQAMAQMNGGVLGYTITQANNDQTGVASRNLSIAASKLLANNTLSGSIKQTATAINRLAGAAPQTTAQQTIIIPNAGNRPTAANLPNPNQPPGP